ncbi:hypothetical protein [Campylobacter armoricus]|uniref:hypothetical protein n=1 Tax=Campylobacter armoricus TaxID=2505970 RepID=UPI0011166798|nr:hypothetical protein [Campylobacter armoricus]
MNTENVKPFIESEKYPFEVIFKDDLFEVAIREASTNKNEISIGIKTLTKNFAYNKNSCYFIFPSHFGIEFLKIFIGESSEYNHKILNTIEQIRNFNENYKNIN